MAVIDKNPPPYDLTRVDRTSRDPEDKLRGGLGDFVTAHRPFWLWVPWDRRTILFNQYKTPRTTKEDFDLAHRLETRIESKIRALEKWPQRGLPVRYQAAALWWFVKRRTRMIVEKALPAEELRRVHSSAKNLGWFSLYGAILAVPIMARVQMTSEHPLAKASYNPNFRARMLLASTVWGAAAGFAFAVINMPYSSFYLAFTIPSNIRKEYRERGFEEEYTYMMRELHKDQSRLIELIARDPFVYNAYVSGRDPYTLDRWYA